VIKLAMVRVWKRLRDEKMASRLILTVHDELIVEAPEAEAAKAAAILQEEMNLMADPMSIIDVDGSSAIYLIFMVIGIIGYFCVPTVSNWIVQAGGMSSYNRNVNNTASKVTNVAGAAAGASTGNVGAVLLKK
jgi:hypothetical protein